MSIRTSNTCTGEIHYNQDKIENPDPRKICDSFICMLCKCIPPFYRLLNTVIGVVCLMILCAIYMLFYFIDGKIQYNQDQIEQEKVKHIITCFTKALLHVFKCIYTYMYRFFHVFDNNILTKLYAFLLCEKIGRLFCLLSSREIDPRVMHILSWISFTLSRRFEKGKFSVT